MVSGFAAVPGLPQLLHHGCSAFILAAALRARDPVRWVLDTVWVGHRGVPITVSGHPG
jgi:hypothetical protein